MSIVYRPMVGRRIVVAEDDGMIAEAICDRLTEAGYEVVATSDSGAGAVEAALAARPDLVLMDVRLKGDIDGIRASELISEKARIPVVYLTGDADRNTLERAKAASAYGYVLKPFHIRNLIVAIEVALDRFGMERRLEDSQLTYSTILGSIAEGVIAVDVEGRVRFMNAVAERLTGWSAREAEHQEWRTVVNLTDPGGDQAAPDVIARAMTSRTMFPLGDAALVTSREGNRVSVDGSITCVLDSLGRVVGATITLRDVTHTRRAESDIKAMAQQLRAVLDTAVDGVLMLDAAGTILMLNIACERLFGYTSGEMTGRNIETLVTPSPLSAMHRGPLSIDRPDTARPLLVGARATICRRRDQSTFPAEISVGEADASGQPLYVGVVHDVSERRELEAAFLDAVGREQRRFGADLHDGLGQDLTGLSFVLEALTGAARVANSPFAADLEQAGELARHALQSCQNIARGLSPVAATDGGLISALRDLVARLKAPVGPTVDISVTEVARLGLSSTATDHLYRIAQEALANALKHAHAKSIKLTLDIEPKRVRLEIYDDGQGVPDIGPRGPGLGLRTMQYRASIIGARFEIASLGTHGTLVTCDCPQAG